MVQMVSNYICDTVRYINFMFTFLFPMMALSCCCATYESLLAATGGVSNATPPSPPPPTPPPCCSLLHSTMPMCV